MTQSSVVDLVLGLLFVFLVFSVAVSGINEAVTRLFALRSQHLWKSLRELLDGEPAPLLEDQRPALSAAGAPEDPLAVKVYAHPMIRQLEPRAGSGRARLSHIPAKSFARALIDTLVPDGEGSTTVSQLRTRVLALPGDSPIRTPLLAIVSEASDRLDVVRDEIGSWFDSRMEALSATYRRHVKILMFGFGLVVAVACNVDGIGAAKQLYRDEALRTAVATQAVTVADACKEKTDQEVAKCTRDEVGKLDQAVRLPVGWPDRDGIDGWQYLGWLAGAMAISQGAPFWFDLLGRARRWRSA